MRPGRILVMDDVERWRDRLSETLRSASFEVDTAETREEAAEKLGTGFYHLLVLDIRMQDEDSTNEEGMDLLRELRRFENSDAVPVLIVSAHGYPGQMREAFRQHHVVDFLSKQEFSLRNFREEVEELFRERMEINLDLAIHWDGGLDAKTATLNLKLDGNRVKQDTSLQALVASELEDLLCRLFHDAKSILLRPLGRGWSGTGVLRVQPFYDSGGGRDVVVKFGDFRQIEQEIENFKRFVEPYVGGGRNTNIKGRRRTPRLGGIIYSLLGVVGERLEDFAKFYERASEAEICQAIDGLFLDTCGAWYNNPSRQQPLNLTQLYTKAFGLTIEGLERHLGRIKTVQGKERLHFTALKMERAFRNPIPTFAGHPLIFPTYEALTHGDFNDQNILFDGQGNSWLIDFQATGPGHILRDVIGLDTIVRVRLLEEATLGERLALEEALAAPGELSQFASLAPPTDASRAVAKAFAVCAHLRSLAGRLLSPTSRGDAREFYAGAMYCGLNLVKFQQFPLVQREHAWLSASLLAERLEL